MIELIRTEFFLSELSITEEGKNTILDEDFYGFDGISGLIKTMLKHMN